jgi:hypothetical protein
MDRRQALQAVTRSIKATLRFPARDRGETLAFFRLREAWRRAIRGYRSAHQGSLRRGVVRSGVDVALVLEAAELLDGELMNIHRRLRDLTAWPRESDFASIRVSLLTLLTMTRGLRHQAVAATEQTGSADLRAAVLRARALVVATQLSLLSRDFETHERRDSGRQLTCEQLAAFTHRVLGGIGRINATWASDAKATADRRDIEAALDRAEASYAALGEDSEVASFVRMGVRTEVGVALSACRVLAAVLELPIEPTRGAR